MGSLDERILLLSTSGATPAREEGVGRFLSRVTHYNLQHRKLRSLDGIEMCKGVKYLYAYNNFIGQLPEGLQECRYLTALYLDHNEVQSLDGLELAPTLEVLLIAHNAIQVVSSHITACRGLRELSLAYQHLPEFTPLYFEPGVLHALSRSLTSLDVSGCGITSFAPFMACGMLHRFVATDNHVSDVEDAASLVSHLYSLEELDVRRNLLTATAGPGGAYRSVLLAAVVSTGFRHLDGKEVSPEHMRFISTLSTRRGGPDTVGGVIGSSLLPVRGQMVEGRAGVRSSSTGRMPGSVDSSSMGISPVTGSVRSSPGGHSFFDATHTGGAARGEADNLVDTDGTRVSGRFGPASNGQKGGPLPSHSRARAGAHATGSIEPIDPASAAAAYAAMRNGGQADTPGSRPSVPGAPAARALHFASPSSFASDADAGIEDDEDRAEDDRVGSGSQGRREVVDGVGSAGDSTLHTAPAGHGAVLADPLDDTLPKYGRTPGLSAWKGQGQGMTPGFGPGDTHITEEEEEGNFGETEAADPSTGYLAGSRVDLSIPTLSHSSSIGRDSGGGAGMSGSGLGRPPRAPSASAQAPALPPIVVPRGPGKPPLLLPRRPGSSRANKVGSASGFRSTIKLNAHTALRWENVEKAPPHERTAQTRAFARAVAAKGNGKRGASMQPATRSSVVVDQEVSGLSEADDGAAQRNRAVGRGGAGRMTQLRVPVTPDENPVARGRRGAKLGVQAEGIKFKAGKAY